MLREQARVFFVILKVNRITRNVLISHLGYRCSINRCCEREKYCLNSALEYFVGKHDFYLEKGRINIDK